MTRPDVRYILPASVQLGDLIVVKYDENEAGISVTKTARVARRSYEGSDRVFFTGEGGEIFRWNPGHKAPRVTLIDRPVQENESLMNMEGETWVFS